MMARKTSSCLQASARNVQDIRDRESALIFGLLRISLGPDANGCLRDPAGSAKYQE
jgi:hypothetical protein